MQRQACFPARSVFGAQASPELKKALHPGKVVTSVAMQAKLAVVSAVVVAIRLDRVMRWDFMVDGRQDGTDRKSVV